MDVNEPGVKIEDISVAFISCMNDFLGGRRQARCGILNWGGSGNHVSWDASIFCSNFLWLVSLKGGRLTRYCYG